MRRALCACNSVQKPGCLVSDHGQTFFQHGHGRAWSVKAKLVPSIGSWRFFLLGRLHPASTVSDIWTWAASLDLAGGRGPAEPRRLLKELVQVLDTRIEKPEAAMTRIRASGRDFSNVADARPTSGHRCPEVGPWLTVNPREAPSLQRSTPRRHGRPSGRRLCPRENRQALHPKLPRPARRCSSIGWSRSR
jgi:hypothetical protein